MATDSNVNLNLVSQSGQTGFISSFKEPGIPVALVAVPKGTIIPPSAMISQTAFNTYVNAKFINDSRPSQYFAFNILDDYKDSTNKPSIEDTGIYQTLNYQFATLWEFRYMQGFGNFLEIATFDQCQYQYDFFYIDSNGTWCGAYDPAGSGGLRSITAQQFSVINPTRKMTKSLNMYPIRVQWANAADLAINARFYVAGYDPSNIPMLQNVVLNDVSSVLGSALSITTTTDIVIIGKMGQGSTDFIQKYTGSLTKACFTAKDLTAGTTLTISSMTFGAIVVAGQAYYYGWAILSAAPASGHVVQISLAATSVVNGIIAGADVVCEILSLGTDGQNAAVHTFA